MNTHTWSDAKDLNTDTTYYYVETKATTFRANSLTQVLLMWHSQFCMIATVEFEALSVGRCG